LSRSDYLRGRFSAIHTNSRLRYVAPVQKKVLLGLALVATVVAAYLPALQAGFVWNDDTYLTENQVLDRDGGLGLIWAEPRASEQYYPLVFTTFWVEKRLWGLNPLGYHLVNLLLHAGSALLLWAFLRRFGLPAAWLAAALFALHPMCVESVAWVTERKNTLSLFLSLVAMHAYLASRHAQAAAAEPPKKRKARVRVPWHRRPGSLYAAALLAFTLALLAKTTASVVPAVLLVLAWWKAGRVRGSDVRPLVPFFAVGAALAFHTAWLEKMVVHATGDEWSLGLAGRLVLAGKVVGFYAGQFLFPRDIAFIYPRWTIDPRVPAAWLPAAAALALLGSAWALRERIGRGPLTVLLLFGGVLFPAMGFFNVYAMRYSYVADHFAYQAVAVAAAGIVCGVASLLTASRLAVTRAASAAAVAVIVFFGVTASRQARVFENAETLWRDTLAKNPNCFMCHTNYGFWLSEQGRAGEAVGHFEDSLRIRPDNVPTLLNLAKIEEDRGRFDAAAGRLRAALAIDPADTTVLINLATVETKAGRLDEAVARYREVLKIGSSADYLAHNGLAVALARRGDFPGAIEEFQAALRANPDYAPARANLEKLLAAAGVRR
jgi:tetratricopeptide (TPR) repeat protein